LRYSFKLDQSGLRIAASRPTAGRQWRIRLSEPLHLDAPDAQHDSASERDG